MAKAQYSVSVTFVAPSLDKERLKLALTKDFEADEVRIVAERDGAVHVPDFYQPTRASLNDLMAVAAEKKVFRWRDVAHLKSVRGNLERALDTGNLIKVRHGVFALPGTENIDRLVQALGPYQSELGRGQAAILSHLITPKTAPEIKQLTGVTRQAVDQTLKKLMKRGAVKRINATGECAEWLYVKSGVQIVDALMQRSPRLGPVERQLLNLLPPSAAVSLRHLRELIPSAPTLLKKLILKRLVEKAGMPKRQIVRLTAEGRKHELYEEEAEHLEAVNDEGLIRPDHMHLLLALEALGEARAIDLTAAAKIKAVNGVGTGQHLNRLCELQLIRQSKTAKSAPTYRLTTSGQDLVAEAHRLGRFSDREEARRAVDEAKEARSRTAFERLQNGQGGGFGGRLREILEILETSAGRLGAVAIDEKLSAPYAQRQSINLALNDLRRRGFVTFEQGQRRKKLWSITVDGLLALEKGRACANKTAK